jgi:hypothetical protein
LALAVAKSGFTPRLVAELAMGQANAFALPWAKAIVVTRELTAVATREELAAVLEHEIGHLREPRSAVVFRTTTVMVLLTGAMLLRWMTPLLLGGFVVTIVVIAVAARRFALKMEHHADAHVGHDDAVYARALEKLYKTNLAPAVMGGRLRSHPDLYDRMISAGHPPAWPRPAPPTSGLPGRLLLLALIALSVAPLVSENFMLDDLSKLAEEDGFLERAERTVAMTGGRGNSLIGVARGLAMNGQNDAAMVVAVATAAAKAPNQEVTGNSFGLLVDLGFCAQARSVSDGARLSAINEEWQAWVERRLTECRDAGATDRY